MSFTGFTPSDFRVFDIPGFEPRMEAIKARIRPKLEAVGRELLPDVARVGGAEAFAHVAKHARRTVNAPDDTWVAFALDRRSTGTSWRVCRFHAPTQRFFWACSGPASNRKRTPLRETATLKWQCFL